MASQLIKNKTEYLILFEFFFQDEPFTSHLPEALFNISRYLLHMIQGGIPHGISKVYPWPLLSVNHYQNIRQTIIVYACVLYIILMANSWIHSSRPIKILDKLTFGISLMLTTRIHRGNWVQIKLSIEGNILENRRIRWG